MSSSGRTTPVYFSTREREDKPCVEVSFHIILNLYEDLLLFRSSTGCHRQHTFFDIYTQTSTTHLKEFTKVSSRSICCTQSEPSCRSVAPAASENRQICFLRPDPLYPAKCFTLTADGRDPSFIALAELWQVWARLGDLPGFWVRTSVNTNAHQKPRDI